MRILFFFFCVCVAQNAHVQFAMYVFFCMYLRLLLAVYNSRERWVAM